MKAQKHKTAGREARGRGTVSKRRADLITTLYRVLASRVAVDTTPSARLQKLEALERRLAATDAAFWPIHERILRSGVHLRRLHAEVRKGSDLRTDYWHTGIELLDALWWEIRAIDLLREMEAKAGDAEGKVATLLSESVTLKTKLAVKKENLKGGPAALADRSATNEQKLRDAFKTHVLTWPPALDGNKRLIWDAPDCADYLLPQQAECGIKPPWKRSTLIEKLKLILKAHREQEIRHGSK